MKNYFYSFLIILCFGLINITLITSNICQGSIDDVQSFLSELSLQKYAESFRNEDIDGPTLCDLESQDLRDLGMSLGHAKKTLKVIASVSESSASSTGSTTGSQQASSGGWGASGSTGSAGSQQASSGGWGSTGSTGSQQASSGGWGSTGSTGSQASSGGWGSTGSQKASSGGWGASGSQQASSGGWGSTGSQQASSGGWGSTGSQQASSGGWGSTGSTGSQQASSGGWGSSGSTGSQASSGGWGSTGSQQASSGGWGSTGSQQASSGGWGSTGSQQASSGGWGSSGSTGSQASSGGWDSAGSQQASSDWDIDSGAGQQIPNAGGEGDVVFVDANGNVLDPSEIDFSTVKVIDPETGKEYEGWEAPGVPGNPVKPSKPKVKGADNFRSFQNERPRQHSLGHTADGKPILPYTGGFTGSNDERFKNAKPKPYNMAERINEVRYYWGDSRAPNCCGSSDLSGCLKNSATIDKTDKPLKGHSKDAVVVMTSESINSYAVYAEAILVKWASKFGLDLIFAELKDSEYEAEELTPYQRNILWDKIKVKEHFLPEYDHLLFLDADIIVADHRNDWYNKIVDNEPYQDIIVCEEAAVNGVVNIGSMILKNTPWTREFLYDWWECGTEKFPLTPQLCMDEMIREGQSDDPEWFGHISILDLNAFNTHGPIDFWRKFGDHTPVLHLAGTSSWLREQIFARAFEGMCNNEYMLGLESRWMGGILAQDKMRESDADPENMEAHSMAAYLLGEAGMIVESKEYWERAIALDPNDAETRYSYGKMLSRIPPVRRPKAGATGAELAKWEEYTETLEEALDQLGIACALQPNNAGFQYLLGTTYLLTPAGIRDYEAAKEALEISTRLNPRRSDAWINLGAALLSLEECEEGKIAFKRAVEATPPQYMGYTGYGKCLILEGKPEEALRFFDKSLEKDPQNPTHYTAKGDAYIEMGAFDEAIEQYQNALRVSPENPKAMRKLEEAKKKKEGWW